MTELNKISQEEKQTRLLDTLSYLPFLFILNVIQNGKNENSMWHAKMGAVSTLIFMIPVFVGAFVSVFFGGMLYGFFFLYIGLSASKAWNGEKLDVPFISKIAVKLPLEKFIPKKSTVQQSAPTSSQVATTNPTTTTPTPIQTNQKL